MVKSDGARAPDIEQNDHFQRAEWRLQRAGWTLMALLVLGTLAGIFGRGPLSRAVASASDGSLEIEYERVQRYEGRTAMVLHPRGGTRDADGRLRIWMDVATARALGDVRTIPRLERQGAAGDRVFWDVVVADDAPVTVEFHATERGRYPLRMWLDGHAPVSRSPFVFP